MAVIAHERLRLLADRADFSRQVYAQQMQMSARRGGDGTGSRSEVVSLIDRLGVPEAIEAKHFGPLESILEGGGSGGTIPVSVSAQWAADRVDSQQGLHPTARTLGHSAVNAWLQGDDSQIVGLPAALHAELGGLAAAEEITAQQMQSNLGFAIGLSYEMLTAADVFGPNPNPYSCTGAAAKPKPKQSKAWAGSTGRR